MRYLEDILNDIEVREEEVNNLVEKLKIVESGFNTGDQVKLITKRIDKLETEIYDLEVELECL